ncbi:LytTR family DNA-binding domain-containing protein [Pedobacter sp. Hv1]|uniref:LytR/AlgR family response regulator transcription factor n=1 Tax=Pedobacter sp. Hv1 TaxID=1740090 RepID=UPI0006D8B0F5|nr:LytTR family DNA-binding domain-containing protein [Pedobacter sp. Hv1]KQC02577.1 two-component system response regulator [Pedobacter sp. Hv1]
MNNYEKEINCIVVDDEPLAIALLSDYIHKTPGLTLMASTSDPMNALKLAKNDNVDLVFLDMQMPELTGLQFMKILQKKCMVIITTAYSEYALESYDHHVVDYLLKPITFDRFLVAVEKAQERATVATSIVPVQTSTPLQNQFIFVKTDYRLVKISLDHIYYLEGARDYVIIHTINEQILTLQSMKSLEDELPSDQFMRIHKSYVIALNKISFIERGRVSINEQLIPISDTHKDRLLEKLKLLR